MCANLPCHHSIVWKKSDWTICGESKKRQLFYVPVSYFQVTVLMEVRNVFDASLSNSVELAPKSLFYLLEVRSKSAVCWAQGKEDSHRSIIWSVINSRYSNSAWQLHCRHRELQPQISSAYSNVPWLFLSLFQKDVIIQWNEHAVTIKNIELSYSSEKLKATWTYIILHSTKPHHFSIFNVFVQNLSSFTYWASYL